MRGVIPLGLLITPLVFDTVAALSASQVLANAAYGTLSAGRVGTSVAAPFGTIDWLAIPAGTRA